MPYGTFVTTQMMGADKKIIKTLGCRPRAVIIDTGLLPKHFWAVKTSNLKRTKNLNSFNPSRANENSHYIPGVVIESDCAVMAWESQFIFYQGVKISSLFTGPNNRRNKTRINHWNVEMVEKWTRKWRGSSSVMRLSKTDVFTEIETRWREAEDPSHVGCRPVT